MINPDPKPPDQKINLGPLEGATMSDADIAEIIREDYQPDPEVDEAFKGFSYDF